MSEEVTPPSGQATETTTDPGVTEAPADFREYVKWRETGELPEAKDEPPSAAADEKPPAKTDPDSEPEDSQETEEGEASSEETERTKRMGSRQRRIDRLTRELEIERREKEELRRQMAAQAVKPAEQPPPTPPAHAGKPKLEDYETLEAYQEALTDWKLDQRETLRKQEAERQAAEQARQEEQAAWAKKERAAQKAHADFDDVLDTIQIPQTKGIFAARQALLESEAGAEILYYLGKNPKELERIAALSPVAAVFEIGKLSVKFGESSPTPENGKPKITAAPKPPPASGRPSKTSSDDINDPDVQKDFSRWMRAREAQLKR